MINEFDLGGDASQVVLIHSENPVVKLANKN